MSTESPAPPTHINRSPDTPQRPLAGFRKYIIVFLISGVFLIMAGGLIFVLENRPPSLPSSVKNSVKFTAFLPTKLPEKYRIVPGSYTYREGVLTFRVSTPSGVILLVSEQQQSTKFDVNSFYKALKNSQSTSTPYGTAQAGTFLKNKSGSLIALGTWVFVSGPHDTDVNQILTVLSSLDKAS